MDVFASGDKSFERLQDLHASLSEELHADEAERQSIGFGVLLSQILDEQGLRRQLNHQFVSDIVPKRGKPLEGPLLDGRRPLGDGNQPLAVPRRERPESVAGRRIPPRHLRLECRNPGRTSETDFVEEVQQAHSRRDRPDVHVLEQWMHVVERTVKEHSRHGHYVVGSHHVVALQRQVNEVPPFVVPDAGSTDLCFLVTATTRGGFLSWSVCAHAGVS